MPSWRLEGGGSALCGLTKRRPSIQVHYTRHDCILSGQQKGNRVYL